MNNTHSLDQIQETGGLKADLILKKYKLDKMTKLMEIKSNNPKLKQSEIAKIFELSSSTIQQYRREINMLSTYRIRPSSKANKKKKQKTPNTNRNDVMVTSKDLKMTSNDPKTTSKKQLKIKNKLKGGGNFEINENNLDELIHNNYL